MATPFYLQSAAQTATLESRFSSATQKKLALTRGAGVVSQADATITGLTGAAPPTDGSWAGDFGNRAGFGGTSVFSAISVGNCICWVSEPLDAVTIAANPTVNLRAAESNAKANYTVGAFVFKVDAGGVSTILATGWFSTELGTTEAAKSFAVTRIGSPAVASGERLGIIGAWMSASGTTSASGNTATAWYNGTTSAASGDAFVSFNETITEQGGAPAADIAYLATARHAR